MKKNEILYTLGIIKKTIEISNTLDIVLKKYLKPFTI